MSQFILKINLGNDAMQTGSDIAESLRDVAQTIEEQYTPVSIAGRMTDVNGNIVGNYQINPPS